MKPAAYYWRCQLSGWGAVVLSNFLVQFISSTMPLSQQLVSNLLFMLLGIISSHGLRSFYRYFHIQQRAIQRMILPWLIGAALATVLALAVTFAGLALFLQPQEKAQLFSLGNILNNLIGVYPLMLIWGSLYLGVHYLWNWREAAQQKAQLEAALHQAQLNTLIGQINPHFMFNALNNIRALMLEDVQKARQAVTLLSKVLRASLSSPQQSFVLLRDELAVVEDFVALATLQYEERLQWHKQVDANCLTVKVPPMLVQILVENAVKHGIAEMPQGGVLQLVIQRYHDQLEIVLTNPGRLDRQQVHSESTGLGVANIEQRLQLLYTGQAKFSLEQQDDIVKATVLLPLDME